MNVGRTVFAQLLSVVPFSHFEHLVDKYQANRWTRDFTAWSHFICMAYAQLTRREGLRDLIVCLNSQSTKPFLPRGGPHGERCAGRRLVPSHCLCALRPHVPTRAGVCMMMAGIEPLWRWTAFTGTFLTQADASFLKPCQMHLRLIGI